MGISATVGGLATSVYYLYGNMTVADVLPEDKDLQDALGDMKDMSAEDFVGLMRRWLDAPDSFDISDLEAKYVSARLTLSINSREALPIPTTRKTSSKRRTKINLT